VPLPQLSPMSGHMASRTGFEVLGPHQAVAPSRRFAQGRADLIPGVAWGLSDAGEGVGSVV
jgi:hypothetical protein